ncbi:hypothetical protein LDENG_00173350 [Lucifuga dentata]|nr:hypothetical protein LDENG_00173350 [Lucifuga dentata]
MSLFCLGFGNDVDYSFLDVMAKENKGLARRIFVASDASVQLQGFYDEVSSPLLLDVDLCYPDNTVDLLTTNYFNQLFNGSEIIVAGRLSDNDIDNFLVEVFGKGPEEDFQLQGQASAVDWDLLEKSEVGTQEEKGNATAKALKMSLQYSFVTPLTSMVVTKDGPDSPLIADKLTESQRQKAERGSGSTGHAATSHSHSHSKHTYQKAARRIGSSGHGKIHSHSDVDGDPHFLIKLPERGDTLCFNIDDKPGTIFNLVRDPKSGFWLNGQIIGKKKVVPDGHISTYFGRFGIVHQTFGVRLDVTTQDISVSYDGKHVKLLWSEITSLKEPNLDLRLMKNCSLIVTLRHSVKFMVVRHTKVWKKRHYQQEYLGFYTLDSHLLSAAVHGLLGQFYHGVEFEVTNSEKPDATMYVKGQALNVTRHWQKDFSRDVKNGENVSCWFVYSNGTGLIDGGVSDYVVSDLFKTV